MELPISTLDMGSTIQGLRGQQALAANTHTGVLTSTDWNKIWVEQQTADQQHASESTLPAGTVGGVPASLHSGPAVPATTSHASGPAEQGTTTDHAADKTPQTSGNSATSLRGSTARHTTTSETTPSLPSRATSTSASSIGSANSPANLTRAKDRLHGTTTRANGTIPSVKPHRGPSEPPPLVGDAAKGKSAKGGRKRGRADVRTQDTEGSSRKRARDDAAGPGGGAAHLTPSSYAHEPSGDHATSHAPRALGGMKVPTDMPSAGGTQADNTMTQAPYNAPPHIAIQRSADYPASPSSPRDLEDLDLSPVLTHSAFPDDEPGTHQQPSSGAQSSASAPADLGSHSQTHNNLKRTPGQAVERYARDAERLRAAGRIAVRILELPGDASTTPLPDDVPGARSEIVEAHVKDALRAILGIPLNGSMPGWTSCDACFETYRTQDGASHECRGELFKACRVCGCPVVRGDNTQVRRHHISKCPPWHAMVHRGWYEKWLDREGLVAAKDGQFFDQAACRVAAAEANGDATVLRTVLLRELKNKEVSKILKRMSATNPLSGIRPKVLTDATVEAMRAEIRRENA